MFPVRNAVVALLSLFNLLPTFVPVVPDFPYGSQPVRGVNLGGWLVLEVNFCVSYV